MVSTYVSNFLHVPYELLVVENAYGSKSTVTRRPKQWRDPCHNLIGARTCALSCREIVAYVLKFDWLETLCTVEIS